MDIVEPFHQLNIGNEALGRGYLRFGLQGDIDRGKMPSQLLYHSTLTNNMPEAFIRQIQLTLQTGVLQNDAKILTVKPTMFLGN